MKSLAYIFIKAALVICLSIVSFGCSNSSSDTPTATTSVSGVVMAGPVNSSSVTVKTVSGTVVAGPVTTGVDGSYTIAIPNSALSGDLTFESSGGTFTDEATTTPVNDVKLSAYINGDTLSAGSSVALDPPNTIIHALVIAGKTKTEANAVFSAAFGFTPDPAVMPKTEAPTTSNLPQRLAALRARSFSYLTKNLGLQPTDQFSLLSALGKDLADGKQDGKDSTGATIAINATTNLPATMQFNYTKALGDCGAASATLGLSATKVQTNSYIFEFIPGMMGASIGKTTFNIKLSNSATGAAVTGKNLALKPVMHMTSMSHSAPIDTITDNNDGTYTCSIYYLMMSSATMGFWELGVTADNETAVFYPSVGMAMPMGTINKVNLKGEKDLVPGMMAGMGTSRNYPLFADSLTSDMTGFTLKLFIAALDDAMMMSWPGISVGTILHDQSGANWPIIDMLVEVSTDNATWKPATADAGTGHWTVSGLTGLTSGTAGKIYIKLTVNGEQKTTDGIALAADGSNGFQTFTVTPGGGMAM